MINFSWWPSNAPFREKCLSVALWVLMLGPFVAFATFAGFYGLALLTPPKTAITVVDAKKYIPESEKTVFALTGNNMLVPMTNHYSAEYRLYFTVDGRKLKHKVDKQRFDNTNVGDSIEVNYRLGYSFISVRYH